MVSTARRTTAAPGVLRDWKFWLALLVVAGLLVLSIFTGVADLGDGGGGSRFLALTRIPRTIALVLAGAAMAMSGLVMQLLTQNRFVEPTTTGTTEWAGLGLLVMMILFPDASLTVRMVGAIIAAFLGTMVFFAFLRRVTLRSSLIVPIVGIMLGAVVEGHEDFVDDLRRAANARGIELRVLGHLSEDEMDAAIATIAVPLAAYRHISASGSIGRWIAAGRRPITLATPWVTELSTTAPGSVTVVEPRTDASESGDRDGVVDALVDAARAALSDPMVTVTNPSHPGLLTTPDAARRQSELLAAHLTPLGGVG